MSTEEPVNEVKQSAVAAIPSFASITRRTDTGYEVNTSIRSWVDEEQWRPTTREFYEFAANESNTVGNTMFALHGAYLYMNQYRTAHANSRNEAVEAIMAIGTAFLEEAEKREWCDEADDFIESLNEKLPSWLELPRRKRKYEVSYRIVGNQEATGSVVIEASSLEEANELFMECPDDYVDAQDELSNASHSNSFDDIEIDLY